ncbi:MAG TPA: IS3 family transposase [Gammaproteobacteria bacterium]|jgi:transposase InsO family protein|nr:IS3 family transposase [Gammaproteobacteria bacterium]
MRYRFIDAHKKAWPIILMCGVLNVSRSGYYHWAGREPSPSCQSNRVLDRRIRAIFDHHKQRYGAPRITDTLHDEGFKCSENRVARRLRILGLKAIQAKKFKVTTDSNHSMPVAPDLIEQDFTAEAPNQKWTSDISYIWTDQGWLYLAVVMDLYSRAIVGWSMNRRMTQQLVCDALTMALFRRHFPKDTIIHSDRGSQYCSKRYQRLIKNNGLRCSMGRRANCYDNAAMESFFHTLKVELVHRERYTTRRMAISKIFEYIETYYNRQRKHSAIGHRIPMLFEEAA